MAYKKFNGIIRFSTSSQKTKGLSLWKWVVDLFTSCQVDFSFKSDFSGQLWLFLVF
jgi:hypothetical protein